MGRSSKSLPAARLPRCTAFDFTDGSFPAAGLIQGTDGDFYGTTEYGGANSCVDDMAPILAAARFSKSPLVAR